MSLPPLYAVIMAGGSGTRFWPASRRDRPKQFLNVSGGEPMLVRTVRRLEGLVDLDHVMVVTSKDLVSQVQAALPELPKDNILAEPQARNTAPCVAWAAWVIEQRDPSAVQLLLPADHIIEPREDFQVAVRQAWEHAALNDALVTFGIQPHYPATGFGYIESEAITAGSGSTALSIHPVTRFVEKPNAERAAEFLSTGRFLWNAGIFCWSTQAIRKATAQHYADAETALQNLRNGGELQSAYDAMPALPVDVAIMEKADNVHVLPVSFAWNDVGSWTALPDVLEADQAGNVQSGNGQILLEDTEDCVVYSDDERLTALLGVKDLVVVQSKDATLVLPKERAQEVKKIVELLRKAGPNFL